MQAKEKHGEPQVIKDYKTQIFKLYHRPGLRVDLKLKKLEEMADKFATGFPFKEGSEMYGYGGGDGYVSVLEKLTRTLHECIKRRILVENGRNLGRMDKTELDSNLAYSGDKKKKKEVEVSAP